MNDRPLREGYKKQAQPEVTQAIRTVIADWDGINWLAVRIVLEQAGCVNLDDMTTAEVRQRFAIMQRPITIKLGGQIHTTTARIEPVRWSVIESPADPWALHCETMEAAGHTHRDTAKLWKAAHPDDRRPIEEISKASMNYRAKRNRERKADENPE